MSLRITPLPTHPTSTSNTTTRTQTTGPSLTNGAPSAPGLPDLLRNPAHNAQPNLHTAPSTSLKSSAPNSSTGASLSSTHPLESRLANWRATQDAMKMEHLRRVYGIAEPVRRGMELKMVREGCWRPDVLGRGAGVHEEILMLGGRETEIGWEDVYSGEEHRQPMGFHDEMEKRLKMNW